MPIAARLTTIFALAAVLLCGGPILVGLAGAEPAEQCEAPTDKSRERPRPPPSSESKVELASNTGPSRLHCRIYFGCPPMARGTAGTVQQ
ncbi:MAG: hypothetical protein Q8L22_05970 [Reyranella sp.]|nr:hypothetical protein [Reyranella sp.]